MHGLQLPLAAVYATTRRSALADGNIHDLRVRAVANARQMADGGPEVSLTDANHPKMIPNILALMRPSGSGSRARDQSGGGGDDRYLRLS